MSKFLESFINFMASDEGLTKEDLIKELWELGEFGYPEHNTNSPECWCNPKIEHYEECDLVIHNDIQ